MFLSTVQFAKAVGVCKNTIVNWERKGWLVPHHISPSGRRFYTEEQVEQIIRGGRTNVSSEERAL